LETELDANFNESAEREPVFVSVREWAKPTLIVQPSPRQPNMVVAKNCTFPRIPVVHGGNRITFCRNTRFLGDNPMYRR
jgi:hypothetical protein